MYNRKCQKCGRTFYYENVWSTENLCPECRMLEEQKTHNRLVEEKMGIKRPGEDGLGGCLGFILLCIFVAYMSGSSSNSKSTDTHSELELVPAPTPIQPTESNMDMGLAPANQPELIEEDEPDEPEAIDETETDDFVEVDESGNFKEAPIRLEDL